MGTGPWCQRGVADWLSRPAGSRWDGGQDLDDLRKVIAGASPVVPAVTWWSSCSRGPPAGGLGACSRAVPHADRQRRLSDAQRRDTFHQLSRLIGDLLHGGSFRCEQIPGRLPAEAQGGSEAESHARGQLCRTPREAPSVQTPWRLSGIKHHRRRRATTPDFIPARASPPDTDDSYGKPGLMKRRFFVTFRTRPWAPPLARLDEVGEQAPEWAISAAASLAEWVQAQILGCGSPGAYLAQSCRVGGPTSAQRAA